MTDPTVIDRKEAARLLDVTTRTVDRYIALGKLERVPQILPGGRVLIYRESVERYVPRQG